MPNLATLETSLRLATVKPRYWLDNKLFKFHGLSEPLLVYSGLLKGKPLLVIGNGPSLNQTPLHEFKSVASIGMNKISLLFPRTQWRPTFILTSNNVVVRQHRDFFAKTDIPSLIAYKSRLFLSRHGRRNVTFFNVWPKDAFSTDFAAGVGCATTVSYICLQFAYYLGADPVIIFGVDHNFQFRPAVSQAYQQIHGADPNHFDPNYFAHGSLWGLPDLENDRRLFRMAKTAFENDRRTIYDATLGGQLTIFPKLSLAEARQQCGL